jgi:hypothetical protein
MAPSLAPASTEKDKNGTIQYAADLDMSRAKKRPVEFGKC